MRHIIILAVLFCFQQTFATEPLRKEFKGCHSLLAASLFETVDNYPDFTGDELIAASVKLAEVRRLKIVQLISESWHPSLFSDPRVPHEHQKFLYLVHGILDDVEIKWRDLLGEPERITPELRIRFIKEHRAYLASIKKLLADPDILSGFPGVSASLISNEKPETFANSGFILEPDIETVFATFFHDMGGRIGSLKGLMRRNEYMPIDYPQNILTDTTRYNEIALAGTSPTGHKLRVIGLFVKTDNAGKPTCSRVRWRDLQKLSARRNLPLILIRDQASANLNRLY